jgi:hypothetical protein
MKIIIGLWYVFMPVVIILYAILATVILSPVYVIQNSYTIFRAIHPKKEVKKSVGRPKGSKNKNK